MPSRTTITCTHCGEQHKKPIQYVNENKKLGSDNFCSKECHNEHRRTGVRTSCSNCKEEVYVRRYRYDKSKTKRFFCSKSCSTQYNNKNKTYGITRSKLEEYVEERLKDEFGHLTLLFNDKTTIGSELDIYCPDLMLAVEINGIVHYEPIYGQKTFDRIINNDQQKSRACYDLGIELAVINTSDHSYINKKTCDRYYQKIKGLIESVEGRVTSSD